MTGPRHRFDPGEVFGTDADAGRAEVAEATLAARSLEASIPPSDAPFTPDLADRIMVAIRREARPRAVGILGTLRHRPSPAGVVESLGLAWARAVGAGSVAVRATALAYVALVLIIGASLSGVAAYSAAGALGLLTPPSRGPDATLLSSPRPLESPTPTEVESPEPSESAEPAETPEPTEAATDDHHDGSGSGDGATPTSPSGEDSGDSGSGSDAHPSDTPRPSSDH